MIEHPDIDLDAFEFLGAIIYPTIPPYVRDMVEAVAIDWTAWETWAAIVSDPTSIKEPDPNGRPEHMRTRQRPASKLLKFPVGRNGELRTTKDPDATDGHRTSTNKRPAGPITGYDLHLEVATRSIVSTNGRDEIKLGPPVPPVIIDAALVPTGTHPGDAVIPMLARTRDRFPRIREGIVDAGYSRKRPERFVLKAKQHGFDITANLVLTERGIKPVSSPLIDKALLIDGGLFSPLLPEYLRGVLAAPNFGTTPDQARELEAPFNERAKYAMRRIARPDRDGAVRFQCPFCAGKVRSRQVLGTPRVNRHVPLVELDIEPRRCCRTKAGTFTASAYDAMWWQPIPFGTTAWHISYGRRQAAERANAGLKTQFTQLDHKYANVFGLTKLTVFVAFAIAGYNTAVWNTWEARRQAAADQPRHRRKRRHGTWHDDR